MRWFDQTGRRVESLNHSKSSTQGTETNFGLRKSKKVSGKFSPYKNLSLTETRFINIYSQNVKVLILNIILMIPAKKDVHIIHKLEVLRLLYLFKETFHVLKCKRAFISDHMVFILT